MTAFALRTDCVRMMDRLYLSAMSLEGLRISPVELMTVAELDSPIPTERALQLWRFPSPRLDALLPRPSRMETHGGADEHDALQVSPVGYLRLESGYNP